MKTFPSLKTMTLALTALATVIACGHGAQADDVVVDGKIITAENYDSARGGHVQGAYGAFLGRDGGAKAQDFHFIPTDQKPGGQMPTDQLPAVQRGGLVQDAYGDVLGRKAGDMPTDQQPAGHGLTKSGPGTLTLGSLNGVGSTSSLFLNSRGGDQGIGLLLPAVQKVREAAARQTAGASVPDAPERGALNFANAGAAKGLNFAITDGTAGGHTGGANNAGAAKGLNFSNTARK